MVYCMYKGGEKLSDFVKERTSVHRLDYRLIWCTMYRQPILTNDVSSCLIELIHTAAKEKNIDLTSVVVHDNSWVECFISVVPKMSMSQVVTYLKGISGNRLLKRYPELKDDKLWNGSYFVESIGCESNADKYIEWAKTHRI